MRKKGIPSYLLPRKIKKIPQGYATKMMRAQLKRIGIKVKR